MAATPTQGLCAHLRSIVQLLERGDRVAAASEVAEMQKLIAGLPPAMPDADVKEAGRLMERYAELGAKLRQDTLASMTRLGAARRVAAYGQRFHRP
jgi:hypothetical protein